MHSLNEEVVIRRAIQSDYHDVAVLIDQLGSHIPLSQGIPYVRDRLTLLLNSDSDCVFVAEVERRVVGLLTFHITPILHAKGYSGRIISFIVDEAYRGKGIGTRLIQEAESWAWSCGCVEIEVTSGEHTKPAHGFYKSQGYIPGDSHFVKGDIWTSHEYVD